jgi:two-component sensor histidine kinase
MAWQTGQRATDVTGFLEQFDGRLRAIAVAQDVMARSGRQGASLAALVKAVLAEQDERLTRRIEVEVEDLHLNATMLQHLALVLHELTQNAARHGALSAPGGSATLTSEIRDETLVLTWREGGGPTIATPTAPGFGSMLLERVVARRYGGRATFDWRPAGLVCTLSLPVAKISA